MQAEKAGYKHFMLKEIYEQPAAVRETILGRVSLDSGQIFLDEMSLTDDALREMEDPAGGLRHVWHAGLVGSS